MCSVSMVVSSSPVQWPLLKDTTDVEVLKKLVTVINMLSEMDKKLGATDCYDPTKDEYISQLEIRIKDLEEKLLKIKEHVDAP